MPDVMKGLLSLLGLGSDETMGRPPNAKLLRNINGQPTALRNTMVRGQEASFALPRSSLKRPFDSSIQDEPLLSGSPVYGAKTKKIGVPEFRSTHHTSSESRQRKNRHRRKSVASPGAPRSSYPDEPEDLGSRVVGRQKEHPSPDQLLSPDDNGPSRGTGEGSRPDSHRLVKYKPPQMNGSNELDELAFESKPRETHQRQDRGTNFSALSHVSTKGHIPRTKFQSTPKDRTCLELRVTAAASGQEWYCCDADESITLFKTEEDVLRPVYQGNRAEDLQWLDVKPNTINTLIYSTTPCKYVFLKRSQTLTSPPELALQFARQEDAREFWKSLESSSKRSFQWPSEKIQSTFDQKMNAAKQFGAVGRLQARPKAQELQEPQEPQELQEPEDVMLMKHRQHRRNPNQVKVDYAVSVPAQRSSKRRSMLADNDVQTLPIVSDIEPQPPTKKPRQSRADDMKLSKRAERNSLFDQPTHRPSSSPPPELQRPNKRPRLTGMDDTSLRTRSKRGTKHEKTDARQSASPPREPSWTSTHPDWDRNWDKQLVFPPTGQDRAVVDKSDIPRLDAGEFLNDNLIAFYIRYLRHEAEQINEGIAKKVYFLNTYFFEKLKPVKGKEINYEGVKRWTAKIDILSYDYLVVPINESAHWYLAIICHPGKLVPVPSEDADSRPTDLVDGHDPDGNKPKLLAHNQAVVIEDEQVSQVEGSFDKMSIHSIEDGIGPGVPADVRSDLQPISLPKQRATRKKGPTPRKYDPFAPRIMTLDSLGGTHSPTCRLLRDYIVREIEHRKGIKLDDAPALGMTAKDLPAQPNFWDCGPFVLGYVQELLKDPDLFISQILQREQPRWTVDASKLRGEVRDAIFRLYNEQQERLAEEKAQRRAQRRLALESDPNAPSDTTATEVQPERAPPPEPEVERPIESPEGINHDGSPVIPSIELELKGMTTIEVEDMSLLQDTEAGSHQGDADVTLVSRHSPNARSQRSTPQRTNVTELIVVPNSVSSTFATVGSDHHAGSTPGLQLHQQQTLASPTPKPSIEIEDPERQLPTGPYFALRSREQSAGSAGGRTLEGSDGEDDTPMLPLLPPSSLPSGRTTTNVTVEILSSPAKQHLSRPKHAKRRSASRQVTMPTDHINPSGPAPSDVTILRLGHQSSPREARRHTRSSSAREEEIVDLT